MQWFYQKENREIGPLTETALRELTDNGVINQETQVRREDSTEWQPCAIAFSLLAKPEQQPEPAVKNQQFKFECPHCKQHIATEEDYSGTSVQCPACGADFVVSSSTGKTENEASSAQGTATERPAYAEEPPESAKTEPSPEPGTSHSFAERLRDGNKATQEGAKFVKEGAMVGLAGLKRRSKQAALKLQIEKLRNIDLRKALHSLGKKAFELDVDADGLAEQFQTIRDLDANIAEMREKAAVDAGETKMAALKRVSKDTAKASQAQALTLKREHLVTELGREIHARKAQMSTQEFSEESTAIADIEHLIRDKEDEIRGLDDGGKSSIQTVAVAAAFGILAVIGIGLFRMIGNTSELAFDPTDTQPVESSRGSSSGDYRSNSADQNAIRKFNETYGVTHTIGKREGLNDMEILRAAVEATDWSGSSSDLKAAVKDFMSIKSGESPASRNKKMEKFSQIMDTYSN